MAAYLDDGTLDLLSVQYRLENGFKLKGLKLVPKAFIMRVDEPERSELGTIVYAKVYALTMVGQKVWLLGEKDLEESGIYDNTWVCRIEQTRQLICWREGTDEMMPVSENLWKNKLEEK